MFVRVLVSAFFCLTPFFYSAFMVTRSSGNSPLRPSSLMTVSSFCMSSEWWLIMSWRGFWYCEYRHLSVCLCSFPHCWVYSGSLIPVTRLLRTFRYASAVRSPCLLMPLAKHLAR